jgi:hypothetical protein
MTQEDCKVRFVPAEFIPLPWPFSGKRSEFRSTLGGRVRTLPFSWCRRVWQAFWASLRFLHSNRSEESPLPLKRRRSIAVLSRDAFE